MQAPPSRSIKLHAVYVYSISEFVLKVNSFVPLGREFFMDIVSWLLVGLFAADILVSIIDGIIQARRASQFEKRLWWLEQHFDDEQRENVFPEFRGNGDEENH